MSDICIRLAKLSDRDQLVCLREALWPKTPAEEHARELTDILEGKPVTTLPLIILVAEASDRWISWVSGSRLAFPRRRLQSIPPGWAMSRVGTLLRTIDTGV